MKKFALLFCIIILLMSCKKNNTTEVEQITEDIIEEIVETEIEEIIEVPSVKIEKFLFPLPSKYINNITSEQGLRDAILGTDVGGGADTSDTFHNAIDIACPEKTTVFASKDGYVSCCYPSRLNGTKWKGHKTYGGMIIINHYDGTKTLYAHLSRTDVTEGTYVKKGQIIGLSGGKKGERGSGLSTGPHLHFAIYLDIRNTLELKE